jgi:tRNA (mo5U34)-methyltransferase
MDNQQLTEPKQPSFWWHRIELPDGSRTPGNVFHGPDGGDWPTTRFGMPKDMSGYRCIDIGAWDGFFSFEAEKRGAEFVLATDLLQEPGGNKREGLGFHYAKYKLNSKIDLEELNIENTNAVLELANKHNFNFCMCYGILYHLKSPLKAMENLFSLIPSGGIILVETAISNFHKPVLEYRPGYDNDPTNYFYPTISWLERVAMEYKAEHFEVIENGGLRATVKYVK